MIDVRITLAALLVMSASTVAIGADVLQCESAKCAVQCDGKRTKFIENEWIGVEVYRDGAKIEVEALDRKGDRSLIVIADTCNFNGFTKKTDYMYLASKGRLSKHKPCRRRGNLELCFDKYGNIDSEKRWDENGGFTLNQGTRRPKTETAKEVSK